MSYLGRKGAPAGLTSADIPDDSITASKIASGAITAADVAADMATQTELDALAYQGEPHIIPGVLYPAVANIMVDGSTALSASTTGPNSSTVASSKYGTVQSDGRMYYYTDIKGSKPIKDPRIGAHFGSQRYKTKSLQLLEQETATHGEDVYSIDGREWMRAYGPWTVANDTYGCGIADTGTSAHYYLEVVGYFSDVSGLINQTVDSTDRGYVYKIDSGSFSAEQTTYEGGANTPLGGRYVDASSLISIVTGLTLGIHTITIRSNATADYVACKGIELIAQDTTSTATKSQIQIPSQNVVSYGKKFTVSGTPHYNPFATKGDGSASTIPNNTTGDSVATGWAGSTSAYWDSSLDTATSLGLTAWEEGGAFYRPVNGGRVIKWVDSTGTIKTSVNMMPPSAKAIGSHSGDATPTGATNWSTQYLPIFSTGAIDHSQAEVAKTFHWREFGNGAANGGTGATNYADASMLSSTADDIAYVMDDGLTGLSGDDVNENTRDIAVGNSGDGWFITFIGTGLTFDTSDNYSPMTFGTSDDYDFIIDAVTVKEWTNGTTMQKIQNVCQNLPYGTHVFQMKTNANASAQWMRLFDVTFHQPKKPPIPEDAVVIADYMLMADFVAQSSAGIEYISKGVRRCSSSRDHFYDNGSPSLGLDPANANGGIKVSQSSSSTTLVRNIGFGINFVRSTYGQTARSQSWYVNDTGHSSADAKTGVGSAWGSFADLDANITLGNNILDTYGATADTNSVIHSATDTASPIHTSSHYQTFETPFLHELVGGDRNMEQTNLVVTPDGKTWDEVTRDTSYLSSDICITTTTDTTATSASTVQIFDEWRGKGSTENRRNFQNKDFAIAYDRMICLVDGDYEIQAHTLRNATVATCQIMINGAVQVSGHGISGGGDYNSVQTLFYVNLQRGDYIQCKGAWYSAFTHNLFQIRRV